MKSSYFVSFAASTPLILAAALVFYTHILPVIVPSYSGLFDFRFDVLLVVVLAFLYLCGACLLIHHFVENSLVRWTLIAGISLAASSGLVIKYW
jgi:hypothetical protein